MNFNISTDNKILLTNFFSLSVLQGVNMILPLVTLPYLVAVLGVEKFGLINFALSIIMLLNLVVSFGFELSATREVSVNRDNVSKISTIFSSVLISKGVLLLLSFFLLFIGTIFIEKLSSEAPLFYCTFGIVIGNFLLTSWVFQGYEKVKYITYINIISRVFFTSLIFAIVKEPEDYIYVPILTSLGVISAGIVSLYMSMKLFSISFYFPNKLLVYNQMKNSYSYFLSRVANTGSRHYTVTLIGIFFGNTILGYYSMVEKLFYAFLVVGGSISQIIYPYMSRTKNVNFIITITLVVVPLTIVLLIPIFYYNKELLFLIYNTDYDMLSNIFIIMFSAALFATINAMIGYPLLAALGFSKHANNSLIYSSIIYIFSVTICTIIIGNIYLVTACIILYELSCIIFRIYYIVSNKLLITKRTYRFKKEKNINNIYIASNKNRTT